MANPVFSVRAIWDPEASVWCSESDVPGLTIETATLGEFEQCVKDFVPELLRDNLGLRTPVSIQFSAARALNINLAG